MQVLQLLKGNMIGTKEIDIIMHNCNISVILSNSVILKWWVATPTNWWRERERERERERGERERGDDTKRERERERERRERERLC